MSTLSFISLGDNGALGLLVLLSKIVVIFFLTRLLNVDFYILCSLNLIDDRQAVEKF